jgi:hypothetical protein
MSFGLGSLVSAVTDPGKIVKEVVDAVLPEELDVVADLAGAAASYYSGRPMQAIGHLADAARDLPQAFNQADGPARPAGGSWRGQPSSRFEPLPPPNRGGDQGGFSLEKLMSMLQSILDVVGGKKPANTSGSSSATTGTTTKTDDADDSGSSGTSSTTSKKTSSTSSSSKDDTALEKLNKLSDADFMAKIRKGDLPKEITDDPKAMLAINQRIAHIGEMTKMMTQMIAALHDMQMSILQNVRA